MRRFALLGWLLLAVSAQATAQETLRVGVSVFPPNVIQNADGSLEGFDVELWQLIAEGAELPYQLEVMPLSELLDGLESGALDAGLAGLSVSATREQGMDFSHPYMRAGLRILTKPDDQPPLLRYVQSAIDSGAARALLYLLGFIVICAHVLYLAERGSDSVDREYVPGIFQAAWCIVATMTTVGYGDVTPHRWLGRFVSFVVMVTGIGLFGVLIADLSAGIALQEVQARIAAPEDLQGRAVATVRDSTSVDVARSYGARVIESDSLDEAARILADDRVDAIVFDGPPLIQYLKTHTNDSFVLTSDALTTEVYAVALPSGSPLREIVNHSLLELHESGARDRLYEKWFGNVP